MKHEMIALGALLAVCAATPAAAADAPQDDDWQVSFTPYVWFAGVKGDVAVPGEGDIIFDQSFIDTLSSLKFAFMGALDVQHRNFVLFVDGNYLALKSGSNDIEEPDHLGGEVKTKILEMTALAGYKVINDGDTSLELLGGARIISLKNDITLQLPLRTVDIERSRSPIAPVVASRFKTSIGGRWGLSLYADIGGMTKLDMTWQLLGAVNYRLSDHWSLAAGYRHLSLRSDSSTADIHVRFSGPLIGATYRF